MIRTANHNLITDSGTAHAAADAATGPLWHILACNGRAVAGGGWPADPAHVTCKACLKGLSTGRIIWAVV